jgi:4-hydroxy-tetrahydrodipicolinate synthase
MIGTALNGNFDLAQKQNDELQDLVKLLFVEGNPTGIKTMMHFFGLCENELRLPLLKCSNELLTRIRTALEPFTKR